MTAPQIKTLLATAALAILIGFATVAAAAARGDDASSSTDAARHNVDKRHKPIYDGLYRRKVSHANKRWARRVSECESGRNPDAIGADGLYRGAFQFSRSTWRTAPQSPGGDPVAFSYRTQAFVAVRLRTRDGDGHWPNCA